MDDLPLPSPISIISAFVTTNADCIFVFAKNTKSASTTKLSLLRERRERDDFLKYNPKLSTERLKPATFISQLKLRPR